MATPSLAAFREEIYAGGGCWALFSQAGVPARCIPPELADLVAEATRRAHDLKALFDRIEDACGVTKE